MTDYITRIKNENLTLIKRINFLLKKNKILREDAKKRIKKVTDSCVNFSPIQTVETINVELNRLMIFCEKIQPPDRKPKK
jgi:hypothetical protein